MSRTSAADTKAFYEGKIVELWEKVWAPAGGHLHMALFESPADPIAEAMERASARMADSLALDETSEVLEVACGLGATARYLARRFGARVLATNISETQIATTRAWNEEAGLSDLVCVDVCDFADLPYQDGRFDAWWCQESLIHAEDKRQVLAEAHRVLKPGGQMVLSVLTLSDEVAEEDRPLIYRRVHAPSMWSARRHEETLRELSFDIVHHRDWSAHVAPTYGWVLDELEKYRQPFLEVLDEADFSRMVEDFELWIDRAKRGDIGWSYFFARKA